MHLVKINDSVVKKIRLPSSDQRTKGDDLIRLYSNTFICSKKNSGKTTVINHLTRNTIDKNTKVFIFCSTVHNDASYKEIIKWMDKKEIEYELFTSIVEGKIDHLKNIMDILMIEAEEKQLLEKQAEDQEKEKVPSDFALRPIFIEETKEIKVKVKKERKPKLLTPKILFIFDDMSSQIRTCPSIRVLLKQNRHFLCNVIISSQNDNDLFPDSRNQIQNWMMFRGFNEEKIMNIYKSCDPSVTFEQFYSMYKQATSEPYNFFFYQSVADKYRKNFNLLFDIEE